MFSAKLISSCCASPSAKARLLKSRAAAAKPNAERRTSRSSSPFWILGSTIIMLAPMRRRTKISSSREKPPLPFPARNVTISVLATGRAVSAVRNNVVGTMITWTLINIRFAPGIWRYFLFEIGPIPTIDAGGPLVQGREPFLRRGITPHIESESVQRRAKKLDLCFGSFRRRFFLLFDELRHNQAGKQTNDDHYDDEFDERKPGGGFSRHEFVAWTLRHFEPNA